jgi:hypothetical protein
VKYIEINEVYSFKMNSGEELVAKVVEVGVDRVSVTQPVSVAPGPQGMGLVPSLFTADHDKNLVINIDNVAIYGVTDENIRVKYIEATTGIATPTQRKVILG